MLLHSCFHLFDVQHDHVLKKLNFYPKGQGRGGLWAKYLFGWGSAGKMFATMLLYS